MVPIKNATPTVPRVTSMIQIYKKKFSQITINFIEN